MTTFAIALKNEIRRLARREAKAVTAPTTKAVAKYRHEIARLKRQIQEQQKRISHLAANETSRDRPELSNGAEGGVRFSARSVKAQRRRTGLSAAEYAKLVGVSALTIYNWEQGKARPRKQQLAALIAVRGLGKREAQRKLELLTANSRKAAPKVRRGRRKKK
jgi:DNA-binding transcriptional regulator YiaG